MLSTKQDRSFEKSVSDHTLAPYTLSPIRLSTHDLNQVHKQDSFLWWQGRQANRRQSNTNVDRSAGYLWELLRNVVFDPFVRLRGKIMLARRNVGTLEEDVDDLGLLDLIADLSFCLQTIDDIEENFDKLAALKKTYANNIEANVSKIMESQTYEDKQMSEFLQNKLLLKNDLNVLVSKEVFVRHSHYQQTNNPKPPDLTLLDNAKIGSYNTAALLAQLSDINRWDVNVFKLNDFSNGWPLTVAAYALFTERDFFKPFQIDPGKFIRFVLTVEKSYHTSLPYHNALHGCDVMLSVHYLLSAPCLQKTLTDLEVMTSLVAALAHDVDHRGVNNLYHIKTRSPLANMYNDESILENHHYDTTCSILKNEEVDITYGMSRVQRRVFYSMLKTMILATDMTKHVNAAIDIQTMAAEKMTLSSDVYLRKRLNDRTPFFAAVLHCADLANPCKPIQIYEQWVTRVRREFFRQGDMEKTAGIPMSPMCDRETVQFDSVQVGFIDVIVRPLWESWARLVYPHAELILNIVTENRHIFLEKNHVRMEEAKRKKSRVEH